MNRILPISSLRFVLAMWVVLSHFGLPVLREPQQDQVLWAARGLLDNLFNGPAAVMVFFVISGFCIHFPNRKGLTVRSWRTYYARRYLRILIPMAAAIGLWAALRLELWKYTDSILWSLVCEEIYYFIYPALLALRDRIGWRSLMVLSWAFAFLTVLTKPHALNYPSYGPAMNWMLGLPCWLLGCKMAEDLDMFSPLPVSVNQIWIWRGGAWSLSMMLSIVRFHTPIGYPWTLNLFAVFAAFWLEREIRYYHGKEGVPLFESPGEASYSIYLTHLHGNGIVDSLAIFRNTSSAVLWFASVILSCGFCTVFYWVVERPSHRFARRFAKQINWLRETSAVSAG